MNNMYLENDLEDFVCTLGSKCEELLEIVEALHYENRCLKSKVMLDTIEKRYGLCKDGLCKAVDEEQLDRGDFRSWLTVANKNQKQNPMFEDEGIKAGRKILELSGYR